MKKLIKLLTASIVGRIAVRSLKLTVLTMMATWVANKIRGGQRTVAR